VVIPVRVPLLSALSGLWLFYAPFFTVQIFDKLRGVPGPASLVPMWMGLSLGVIWFTMIFTIKQVLTLSSAEMGFQIRILEIGVKKSTCATSRLQNLRFVPSEYGDWVSWSDVSRIQIDRDSKTRSFAFGITELEADTLIEKMMEVYKFPSYPATGASVSAG
jgi:hypothetical protein